MRGRRQGKRNDPLEKYEDYIKNFTQESDTGSESLQESQGKRNDLLEKYEDYIKNFSQEFDQSSNDSDIHKRNNANKTDAKLAKIAGVSRGTMSKFEAIKKIGSVKDILEIREGNREKSIIPVS